MEKNEKRVVIKYLHMKGLSVQIHLDVKEVLGDILLHKQQSTDGQPPLSVVDSQLKTSTVLVARLTYALRKLCPGYDIER